jgi:hypothetical protein
MTSVFLFISILLNIIALFFIVILYLRQSKLFEVENKQRKMIEEMEDVISTYLAEMKEENENFINRITNAEKSKGKKKESRNSDEGEIEPLLPNGLEEKVTFPIKGSKSQAVKAYQTSVSGPLAEDDIEVLLPGFDELETSIEDPSIEEEEKGTVEPVEIMESKEKTLLEEVLYLKEQGLSFEEIAKKLHKGQTEIELLLKFRQNNQE